MRDSIKYQSVAVACGVFLISLMSPVTKVVAIELFGLVAYFALVYLTVRVSGVGDVLRSLSRREKITLALVAGLFIVASGYYLEQYRFHPTWDQSLYWSKTLDFDASLQDSVHRALFNVYASVNSSDYNQLLAWVLSFPARVFPSWEGLFFCVFALFHVLTCLLVSCFASTTMGCNRTRNFIPMAFLCALSFPMFSRIPLIGLADAPAVLLMAGAACCFFSRFLPERPSCAVGGGLLFVGHSCFDAISCIRLWGSLQVCLSTGLFP